MNINETIEVYECDEFRLIVEIDDTNLLANVTKWVGKPGTPRRRKLVKQYSGETAWSDAQRHANDLAVKHRFAA